MTELYALYISNIARRFPLLFFNEETTVTSAVHYVSHSKETGRCVECRSNTGCTEANWTDIKIFMLPSVADEINGKQDVGHLNDIIINEIMHI